MNSDTKNNIQYFYVQELQWLGFGFYVRCSIMFGDDILDKYGNNYKNIIDI